MIRPLVGEPLPLDLVNTAGSFGDALADLADLRAWLGERGLHEEPTPELLGVLREARAVLRGVLERRQDPRARLALDELLDRGRLRVRFGEAGVEEHVEAAPEWRLAFAAARELVALLDQRGDRVRGCGSPACVLWFLDTTRPGTRRWCSMATCGNRTKAHRHRHKQA